MTRFVQDTQISHLAKTHLGGASIFKNKSKYKTLMTNNYKNYEPEYTSTIKGCPMGH